MSPKCLGSPIPLSDVGNKKDELKLSEHLEDNVCLTSLLSTSSTSPKQGLNKIKASFSTAECPPKNKKMTSIDNNSTSEIIYLTNTRDSNCKKSQTSDQGSTSKDQDFYEFWDSSKKDLYQQLLWLPETGWQGLESNSLNGCSMNSTLKSSFSTLRIVPQRRNLEKTSCPSFKYTVVDGTEKEDIPQQRTKTFKLRLCPTKEQKVKLEKMAGCYRFTYNKAVKEYLRKGNAHKTEYKLRDRFVTLKKNSKPNPFFNNKHWLLECPKSARQKAIKQAIANVKSCFTNLRNKNIKRFQAPFKRKRLERQKGWSIDIEKANVKKKEDKLFIFKEILGEMKYRSKKQLHKLIKSLSPEQDPRIQKTAFQEYFLVLSIQVNRREPKSPLKVVSIDPGVRKTLTTYSPSMEECFMFGKGQSTELMTLLVTLDGLYSEKSTVHGKKKAKIQRKIIKLRKRLFYLKKEFRDQVGHFIAKRYDVVLMPKLNTRDLSMASKRKLKTKVVRGMLGLGHSMIYQRLKEKCWEMGSCFMEVKEHYTSQTCPKCGTLNKCNETYRCHGCHFETDRDLLGSANIFLKAVRNTDPLV
jgi:putative transposase